MTSLYLVEALVVREYPPASCGPRTRTRTVTHEIETRLVSAGSTEEALEKFRAHFEQLSKAGTTHVLRNPTAHPMIV
jgi:hypothetical protein